MSWIALATFSALLSAAAAVAQKRTLARLPALECAFLLAVLVLLLSSFVPFTAPVFALTPRAFAVLWTKSVLGSASFLLILMALEREAISRVMPVMGLTPAAAGVLALVLLRDRLGAAQWAGLALMAAGTWALEAQPVRGPGGPQRGAAPSEGQRYIAVAMLLSAVSAVGDKLLVTGMKVPPPVVLWHQYLVYTVLFALALVVRRRPTAAIVQAARAHAPWLVAIAAFTLGYTFLQLAATRTGPVAVVLAIKRTSVLWASLLGGRLFAEERLVRRAIGAAVIVAAGFLFLR